MTAKGTGRNLQPKDHSLSPIPSAAFLPPAPEPKGKRRCVATACIPCRRRKSKCDGGLPKCSTCIAVYKTDCTYDPGALETSQRKTTPATSKRASAAVQETTSAEYLVQRLLNLPESEAIEAVFQLRANGDIDALAESLRKNVRLSEPDDAPSVEGDHAHVRGDIAVGQKYRYGFSSGLGLVPNEDVFKEEKPQVLRTTQLWTDVTTDYKLVKHLIKLYFTWTNNCYPVVNEREFYADFASGKTDACSSILVNAICANGALLTDDPDAREDPNDPRTAGDVFGERAKQLLFEDDVTPRLTTVQALQVLSMREASSNRVSAGFRYAGWALTSAVELGMHLEGWKTSGQADTLRKKSFWAMFNCDTTWSLCVGRAALLPRAAVEIEKPSPSSTPGQWQLYNDGHLEAKPANFRQSYDQEIIHRQSILTEILSELLVLYFAPRERLSSRRILDIYTRLRSWYSHLPSTLDLAPTAAPNVFQLHMWYWTCVNHLFRPIVRMKLVGSKIQPRKVCIDAANQVASILDLYRVLYPMRTTNLTWTHMLLTAGLTHIFDLPSKDLPRTKYTEAHQRALRNTAQCIRDLASVSYAHSFALRCIQIICAVSEKHGLFIPQDVLDEVSPLLSPRQETMPTPETPASDGIPPFQESPITPHRIAATTAPQTETKLAENQNMYAYPPVSTQPLAPVATYITNPPAHPNQYPSVIDSAPNFPSSYFFTPVDGQIGVPLYHNHPPQSHMDLGVMLGAVNWPEQLRQDGFELSDVWGSDPMVGKIQLANGMPPVVQQSFNQAHGQGPANHQYPHGWR